MSTHEDAARETQHRSSPGEDGGLAPGSVRRSGRRLRPAETEIVRHRPYPSVSRAGQGIMLVAIVVNAVLAAGKFVAGIAFQSTALIADAWQSVGDVAHATATLFALRWAALPADEQHRYGHGNIETLASMLVAAILLATGAFIVYEAIQTLAFRRPDAPPGLGAAVAAAVAMLIKIVLARRTSVIADRAGSPLLRAAATDHWQDVLTSIVVILGIIGANLGLVWLDPIAALLVGVMILLLTAQMIRYSLNILLAGMPLDRELEARIEEAAMSVRGVKDVHNLKLHQVGAWTHITVDVAVPGEVPVREAHIVAVEVTAEIAKLGPSIGDVHVQVDPFIEGRVHDATTHRPFHIDSPRERPPTGDDAPGATGQAEATRPPSEG